MSEMRWVLLGGAAIVLAMVVAWTMQSETGPMPVPDAPPSALGATSEAEGAPPDPNDPDAPIEGPSRVVGKPTKVRATWGNPLAAQLHRDKMVPVEPAPKDEEPAPADK